MERKHKRLCWLCIVAFGLAAASCTGRPSRCQLEGLPEKTPADTLPSSLHGTAGGMKWWYEQPDGFGRYSGVSYADAGCGQCHTSTCDQCHEDEAATEAAVEPDACKGCHGRIQMEEKLKISDLHFKAGMLCSNCHSSDEVHGDGNRYDSMFSPGAMDVKCENCHRDLPDNPEHKSHGSVFHCDACHVETVITCYNCHFDTLIKEHKKESAAAFKDFIILLNDQDGKVRAGTYQSVVYGDKTFVAFGPYHGHTITAEGRTCKDCHNSDRMEELRDTGKIVMTWWDEEKGQAAHTTGVIPFTPERFEFQFLTLDKGAWAPLSNRVGCLQYRFCSPLTPKQLDALGALK